VCVCVIMRARALTFIENRHFLHSNRLPGLLNLARTNETIGTFAEITLKGVTLRQFEDLLPNRKSIHPDIAIEGTSEAGGEGKGS
jgi:hypothetical protein